MLVSDFDYHLPEQLIAQEPSAKRDRSRLLVIDRASRAIRDSVFERLPEYLRPGDLLVVNNTRVFPARLIGQKVKTITAGKTETGRRVEVFLVRRIEHSVWESLVRPGKALRKGAHIRFADGKLTGEIIESLDMGRRIIRFSGEGDTDEIIDLIGHTPLPPYIKRDQETRLDVERYQTVYARERGAVAAPTAGLHFTPELLDKLRSEGVQIAEITLHVGYGTFQPVRVERVEDHRVEAERYAIGDEAAGLLNRAIEEGRRVIAVGTTTTRALESASRQGPVAGRLASEISNLKSQIAIAPGTATTDLFIHPGFKFQVISGLITNFHLPRSSLLMLVSAFASRELILEAYHHAVEREYRFYSYGDAMLIV